MSASAPGPQEYQSLAQALGPYPPPHHQPYYRDHHYAPPSTLPPVSYPKPHQTAQPSSSTTAANNSPSLPSPPRRTSDAAAAPQAEKRKPGRPKGSKTVNRKRPVDQQSPNSPDDGPNKRRQLEPLGAQGSTSTTGSTSTVTSTNPPPTASSTPSTQDPTTPPIDDATLREVYDFQWRALNLCSEFYTAAAELISATPANILAHSFQTTPDIDPLVVLQDAKKTCDMLLPKLKILADMRQVSTTPTTFLQNGINGNGNSKGAANPINTPDSLPRVPQSWTPSVAPLQTQHPTASPSVPPAVQHAHTQNLNSPPSKSDNISPNSRPLLTTSPLLPRGSFSAPKPNSTGAPGPWRDEEIVKLKKLVEESKRGNEAAEIDWDWVARGFGDSRSRQQVLVQAASLGLKQSSTHPAGVKRRHETLDAATSGETPSPSLQTPRTSISQHTSPSLNTIAPLSSQLNSPWMQHPNPNQLQPDQPPNMQTHHHHHHHHQQQPQQPQKLLRPLQTPHSQPTQLPQLPGPPKLQLQPHPAPTAGHAQPTRQLTSQQMPNYQMQSSYSQNLFRVPPTVGPYGYPPPPPPPGFTYTMVPPPNLPSHSLSQFSPPPHPSPQASKPPLNKAKDRETNYSNGYSQFHTAS